MDEALSAAIFFTAIVALLTSILLLCRVVGVRRRNQENEQVDWSSNPMSHQRSQKSGTLIDEKPRYTSNEAKELYNSMLLNRNQAKQTGPSKSISQGNSLFQNRSMGDPVRLTDEKRKNSEKEVKDRLPSKRSRAIAWDDDLDDEKIESASNFRKEASDERQGNVKVGDRDEQSKIKDTSSGNNSKFVPFETDNGTDKTLKTSQYDTAPANLGRNHHTTSSTEEDSLTRTEFRTQSKNPNLEDEVPEIKARKRELISKPNIIDEVEDDSIPTQSKFSDNGSNQAQDHKIDSQMNEKKSNSMIADFSRPTGELFKNANLAWRIKEDTSTHYSKTANGKDKPTHLPPGNAKLVTYLTNLSDDEENESEKYNPEKLSVKVSRRDLSLPSQQSKKKLSIQNELRKNLFKQRQDIDIDEKCDSSTPIAHQKTYRIGEISVSPKRAANLTSRDGQPKSFAPKTLGIDDSRRPRRALPRTKTGTLID